MVLQGGQFILASGAVCMKASARCIQELRGIHCLAFPAANDDATLFDADEYKELWLLALLVEIVLQPSGFASNVFRFS